MEANVRTGIYEIFNSITGQRYIGSALKFSKRWREHCQRLNANKHHSWSLQADWNKHGESAFQFKPLIICDRNMLLFYEQRAIDELACDYNVARIAGSPLGVKRSDATRAKLSAALKGNTCKRGSKLSPESRARISASIIGRVVSEETKRKKSQATKGRPKSPETLARMIAANTPEYRARHSTIMLGVWATKRGACLTSE